MKNGVLRSINRPLEVLFGSASLFSARIYVLRSRSEGPPSVVVAGNSYPPAKLKLYMRERAIHSIWPFEVREAWAWVVCFDMESLGAKIVVMT